MNFLTVGIPPSVLKNRTVRYACSFYVIRFSLPCGKDTENLPAGKSGLIKNMYLCRRFAKRLTVEVTYRKRHRPAEFCLSEIAMAVGSLSSVWERQTMSLF